MASTKVRPRIAYRRLRSLLLALVVKEDVDKKDHSSSGRGEEEKYRQAWITPDPEAGFHSHQHGGADNQCGDDQSDRDPICHFLKTENECLFIDRIHRKFQLIIRDGVDDLIDPCGQPLQQIL